MEINGEIKRILDEGKEIENRKIASILKKYNDGQVNGSVFRIPLNLLKYNIQNGRIATFCVQNMNLVTNLNEIEIKNAIKNDIISSNKISHEKTKNSIKLYGQEEPGIILLDGTVIDGNRRFTCLLELNEENPNDENFKYFNAFILKGDVDAKTIKELELNVQLGKDEKVDYNLMDRYMDVYNVVKLQRKMTAEEYAKSSNKTKKEIEEIIEINLFLLLIVILFDLQVSNNSSKYEVRKTPLVLLPFPFIFNLFFSYILFLLNSNNSLTLTPVKNKKEKIIQFLLSNFVLNLTLFLTFSNSLNDITCLFICCDLGNLISWHRVINLHLFSNLNIDITDAYNR